MTWAYIPETDYPSAPEPVALIWASCSPSQSSTPDAMSSGRNTPERPSSRPTAPEKQHYDVMPVEQMAEMPVAQLAAPDCALFMWSTSSHTEQAFWLARRWGFTFSSKAFCWAKENKSGEGWFMGMGHGTRRNTEDCWLFVRGQPKRMDKGVRELVVSPLREHSRKPDEIYGRIERLFRGPYCELFSRQNRTGWSSWGNEKGKFDG